MFRFLTALTLSTGLICSAFAAQAEDANPVQMHNSNAVWFENWIGLTNGSLVVAAPDGTISQVSTKRGTPVFKLSGADVMDGVYRFELRAATDKEDTRKRNRQLQLSTGEEEEEPRKAMIPFYRTGYFVVKRGVIITPEEVEEEEG